MTLSDPIADMLTRIRNAATARLDFVVVPASKIKIAVLKILKEEGFIRDYEVLRGTGQRSIKVYLAYAERKRSLLTNLERVSKPGLRIYVGKGEIPRVYGGTGIAILSTPAGVMTGEQAHRKGVGGEILCYVW